MKCLLKALIERSVAMQNVNSYVAQKCIIKVTSGNVIYCNLLFSSCG